MKLIELSIKNYKSIKSINKCIISPFQILIGENNSGKSNVLNAIEIFLSAGSGGVKVEDFYSTSDEINIKIKFKVISSSLKKAWQPYMIGDELILEKHIFIEKDLDSGKSSIKAEFHGYKAEPKEWFLSTKKIIEIKGDRPKWKDIVIQNKLPSYFIKEDKCNKSIYDNALQKYLNETDIEYDEPDLSSTQALGYQSKVVSNLPSYYLLEAITDYSDEIDKRSANTTFRRLMTDLSERILKKDPKYIKVEEALKTIDELLNENTDSEDRKEERLITLGQIENKIKGILVKLMPSVDRIKLKIITEDVKTIFSKGVEIAVDDGVETDVLLKGHGLQRCIVFSLLQTLILNERDTLLDDKKDDKEYPPIILAIEEPEIYIHPQIGKLFYDVLSEFSKNDQVIYTTHSPRFIDVYEYESIALVSKTKSSGTIIQNCNLDAFKDLPDKKIFKGLTQLNSDVNELFFARNVIVVEGVEDKIAISETLKKLKKISIRPEELQITIVVAGGKQSIPFFIRILNAFNINYSVLHDFDIFPGMIKDDEEKNKGINKTILDLATNSKVVTFPIKLENTLSLAKNHLKDQYEALSYFTNHTNINGDLEAIIKDLIRKLNISIF
jgi:putative ATP-dependent endonuclease of the OLD family